MKRPIVALAAAALVAAALPSPAQAHCRGCGVAAGVFGGVAAGAIIGSAIAAPPPAAGLLRAAASPPPATMTSRSAMIGAGPACHIETMQVWDGYGYRPRHTQVCD